MPRFALLPIRGISGGDGWCFAAAGCCFGGSKRAAVLARFVRAAGGRRTFASSTTPPRFGGGSSSPTATTTDSTGSGGDASETAASMDKAAAAIREAKAVLICAGAGMGVDSGLPDFRGNEGFWRAYPAMRDKDITFVEMANPRWFDDNPELALGFYGHRMNMYRRVPPHAGFSVLLDIVKQKDNNYFIFTSNVDGHFQKAGFDENKIVEYHGSIHHWQCHTHCNKRNQVWDASHINIVVDEEEMTAFEPFPDCPHCSDLPRPNILMFDDKGWIPKRTRQQQLLYDKWLKQIREDKVPLVVLEFGAGNSVPTVRYNSEFTVSVLRPHAKLVRVNRWESQVPYNSEDYIAVESGALQALLTLRSLLQL